MLHPFEQALMSFQTIFLIDYDHSVDSCLVFAPRGFSDSDEHKRTREESTLCLGNDCKKYLVVTFVSTTDMY